ncbi:hypothetical protein LOTGIDRAFT_144857 [Lottia gigantea]|uniref:Pyridoxal kinase n=1 Tax=Lottia gigantea TaxID=225164 RepID=V4AMQ3_LOTGI|nr:hypothetical protein LOTGIDRAFT_144857 [Lottia gigantea]ESO94876.1 hypothetical protein LOTGIDRAFT_144857 [Lottia gigantea]
MSETELRVLSIQSSVVYGYVGNKCATFPLQVLGFDVSTINSVQFSNHKGYGYCKGQVLNHSEVSELYDGLKHNNLINFSHVLTGYIGSKCFLEKVSEMIKEIKENNPKLIYVCDPVMGDNGKMYVPQDLLPVYRDMIIPLADILTPNQFELEVLTEKKIEGLEDALSAIDILHNRGVPTVVLSSSNLGTSGTLLCVASSVKSKFYYFCDGKKEIYKIEFPLLPAFFSGTGDLFAASLLAWSQKDQNLKLALEKTVSTVQAVIKRTLNYAKSLSAENEPSKKQLELRIIQSKKDLENPEIIHHAVPV